MEGSLVSDANPEVCLRVEKTLHETVYLQPFVVDGGDHIELKVEIYKMASGRFSTSVFALEFFNLEEIELPHAPTSVGVVPLFVADANYDLSEVLCDSPAEALHKTLAIIQTKLAITPSQVQFL